jgi:hypothetical protein
MAAETRPVFLRGGTHDPTQPNPEQTSPEQTSPEQSDAEQLERALKKLRERSGEEWEFPEE